VPVVDPVAPFKHARMVVSPGSYYVTFPFSIANRVVLVSVQSACCASAVAVNYEPFNSNTIEFDVYKLDDPTHFVDRPISIVVY